MGTDGINPERIFPDRRNWDMSPDWGPSFGSEGCTITGTINADDLVGTPGKDVICGLGGNDRIRGLGGNDLLVGGDGNDTLDGGPGADRLAGNAGNDTLLAKDGKVDILNGGPGRDTAVVDSKKHGKKRTPTDRLQGVERLKF
jgi:Ca2+-binding RTX toxin-like protein